MQPSKLELCMCAWLDAIHATDDYFNDSLLLLLISRELASGSLKASPKTTKPSDACLWNQSGG